MVGTRLFANAIVTVRWKRSETGLSPSSVYEIYIAETLKHSRAQNWYGKIKGETVSHASFVPFGIRLLAPIQGGFIYRFTKAVSQYYLIITQMLTRTMLTQ